ncbi:MAG: diaminohydroxyphosphoribosylaminopyrimidine deaminase [Micromonosporaceae bacterium]|jgi:diaminohydroxyphosphoribosylaminopyrimidine deaminase/5-amino-6-(5-phosphoribosylamino)uracil reductase|nr:diaminohydroxyphosphoribosylaminopyrimidine deaminase [Micromonosporaceae bacterium]
MAAPNEIEAMRQAVAVSALGLGTTSPNPPVGCVILDRNGHQVGAGYHQRKGEPHAEAHALVAAGSRAQGGTAVVTLEPCNHVGVTPACRQLLLDAEISRVVIAIIDPTSRDEGGAAVLKAAGIDVEVGLLADEALLVLGPWLTATARQRPWVTWAYSTPSNTGDSVDLTVVSDLREQADIVVGADGRIAEGIPGGHGKDKLHYPVTLDLADPIASLTQLYRGGIRTVLVAEDAPVARALLASGAIDQAVIDLARDQADIAAEVRSAPVLLPGFRVQTIATTPGAVRVVVRRST